MRHVMSLLSSLLSVALAAGVGLAAHQGPGALAAAVAVTVVLVAAGWGVLLDVDRARVSTAAVIAVSGLGGVALAWVVRDEVEPLAGFAGLLAGCVVLAFAHQLLRRDGRSVLVESVTATLSGQVIAVLAAGWMLLPDTRLGLAGLTVAAAALGASSIVVALPIESNLRGWAAFAAGVVISAVAAVVVADGDRLATGLVGAAVAAVASGTSMLLRAQPQATRWIGVPAAAAGPVSAVGTVDYAVARLSGG